MSDMQLVRVWDLPTRIFHWSLAASFLQLSAPRWIGGRAHGHEYRGLIERLNQVTLQRQARL